MPQLVSSWRGTVQVKWSRDDRKTPREMIRRESDQPGRDRGPPRRRRSFSPGYRSPGPSRRDRDRSPGGYRSPPPRSPGRSPIRSGDRDGSPPRSKRSPDRREYSGSPPLCASSLRKPTMFLYVRLSFICTRFVSLLPYPTVQKCRIEQFNSTGSVLYPAPSVRTSDQVCMQGLKPW